jgi:hypothetical protein
MKAMFSTSVTWVSVRPRHYYSMDLQRLMKGCDVRFTGPSVQTIISALYTPSTPSPLPPAPITPSSPPPYTPSMPSPPPPTPSLPDPGLGVGYYQKTCYRAVDIVREGVRGASLGIMAGLIHLFFHVCFVKGKTSTLIYIVHDIV